MEKKFSLSVSTEFMRRTMSLISPTVMLVIVLSFSAFKAADVYGENSMGVKFIIYTPALAIMLSILIVIMDVYQQRMLLNKLNYIINVIICGLFIILCTFMAGYAINNAASLYKVIAEMARSI